MILTSRKQRMKETMTIAHKDHRMKEMNVASKDLRLNMIRAHGKQRRRKKKGYYSPCKNHRTKKTVTPAPRTKK